MDFYCSSSVNFLLLLASAVLEHLINPEVSYLSSSGKITLFLLIFFIHSMFGCVSCDSFLSLNSVVPISGSSTTLPNVFIYVTWIYLRMKLIFSFTSLTECGLVDIFLAYYLDIQLGGSTSVWLLESQLSLC